MMKRVVIPELLDTDNGTPREINDSLADLRMINRWFGGTHAVCQTIRKIAAARRLDMISLLDVAGGGGDVSTIAAESLANSGIRLNPVVLDRAASHLNRRSSNHHASNHLSSNICGDALMLPFADNSFDIVGSSLFIHHLEPPQIVQSMREALRVARHAVFISDLIRHPLHLALSYAGYALYRSRLTRHDAVASVRRAYTKDEMAAMLRQVPAAKVEIENFFLFRMGVIAWKPTQA
jgi:ubiquinone/menaquinone biosynthesis C-methylase UbiE